MSLPSPIEPLNGGRVLARTFQVFSAHGLRLLAMAAFSAVCGELISMLVNPLLADAVKAHPAMALLGWAARFPTFVIADAGVVVIALMALGGQRPRLSFAFLAALGLLPVCLVVDLVENLPDIAATAVFGAQAPDEVRYAASLLVAILWSTLWMPAIAAAAEEHHGPIATLRRSFELVRGNLLRVFAFAVLIHVGQELVAQVIVGIMGLASSAPLPRWAGALIETPFFAFASTSQATLYWELARLRDGVNRGDVGTIFD